MAYHHMPGSPTGQFHRGFHHIVHAAYVEVAALAAAVHVAVVGHTEKLHLAVTGMRSVMAGSAATGVAVGGVAVGQLGLLVKYHEHDVAVVVFKKGAHVVFLQLGHELQAVCTAHTVCLQLVAHGEMAQQHVLLSLELTPVLPYLCACEGELFRLSFTEGQPQLYQLRFVVADGMLVGVVVVYLEVLQRVVILLVHFPGEGAVGVAYLQIVVGNALHAHTAVLAHRHSVGIAQLHRIDGEHEFLVYTQHHEAA